MTDIDQRLGKVESGFERVVVILEGEPVLDIDGTKIDTKGGLVRQGERHAEGLNVMSHQLDNNAEELSVMSHKLDNILAQLPRCWTRTQRISASMVVVVALGSISVWMLRWLPHGH